MRGQRRLLEPPLPGNRRPEGLLHPAGRTFIRILAIMGPYGPLLSLQKHWFWGNVSVKTVKTVRKERKRRLLCSFMLIYAHLCLFYDCFILFWRVCQLQPCITGVLVGTFTKGYRTIPYTGHLEVALLYFSYRFKAGFLNKWEKSVKVSYLCIKVSFCA